jgi:transcription antitermination factor NusG
VTSSTADRYRWFALYVKPRHEKAVAAMLRGKGMESLLPLYRSRGPKGPELPVFPSYVFGRLDAHDRLPVLGIPGVFFIVSVGKIPAPVDENEIAVVALAVASGCRVRPHPQLPIGQRVRMQHGPLRGAEGVYTEYNDGTGHLIVTVTLLNRAVAVEVDPGWVAPVGRSVPPL